MQAPPPPARETVRDHIDAWAEADPERPFLIAPETGAVLSARGLRAMAQEVSGQLAALGLRKDDKAAFLMDNGLWTTALFLGAMYGGRVVVPLNAVAGRDQLAYVLEHSDAKVLFVSARYREKFAPLLAEFADRVSVVAADQDRGIEYSPSGDTAAADALAPVEPDDVGVLIYTSGTTGRPKGVLMTHRNALAGGRNTAVAHELSGDDRVLCVLPLYHINGEMVTVMAPLVSRGSVVMPHRYSTSQFWALITQHRCTWFSVVPTIVAYLLEQSERDGGAFDRASMPQLRFGRSASAPLSPAMHETFEQRFQVPMIETMGLTETAAQILSNPMPPTPPRYGSPGVPYGNEAKIIDKQGRELGPGEEGELIIRGPNVAPGYYKNPEATREALSDDGWLRTGDLARRDEDGYYFITGRLKEIIIKGGENIAPREIDETLYQHPAVLEAAAFAVVDERYGQEVMACVVLKPGAQCTEAELAAFCADRLGSFKSPKEVHFLDTLPKGPSGKIQRLKLAEHIQAGAQHP